MTAVSPYEGHVKMLSLGEIKAELTALTRRVEDEGVSLDEFKALGDRWELNAKDRGLLAKIRGMEFLLKPRSR